MFKQMINLHKNNLKTRSDMDYDKVTEKEAVAKVFEEMEELSVELTELSSGIVTGNKDKVISVLPKTLDEAVDVVRSIFTLFDKVGADFDYWWYKSLKKTYKKGGHKNARN